MNYSSRPSRSWTVLQATQQSPTLARLAELAADSTARLRCVAPLFPAALRKSVKAGAIDDAAAWCVLAIVLASFGGEDSVFLGMQVNPAVLAIAGGVGYTAFMLTGGRRLLAKLGGIVERDGGVSSMMLAIVLILFCLSAWFTDAIGIHAVFGGFILGISMPRGAITRSTMNWPALAAR